MRVGLVDMLSSGMLVGDALLLQVGVGIWLNTEMRYYTFKRVVLLCRGSIVVVVSRLWFPHVACGIRTAIAVVACVCCGFPFFSGDRM